MSDATRTLGGNTPTLPLTEISVEATDGPGKGARGILKAGTFFIGSDAGCDLQVKDDAVSRRHCSLELLSGEIQVKDLGSRNGTRYLGAKVTTARVPAGGAITIGKTTLQLKPLAEPGALPASDREELHGLVARSHVMKQVFAQLERVGPSDATVLLTGETGVGKGAAAKAIHALSPRANRPFFVFDCAAAHRGTVESALFGHAKGAFTGADRDRPGAVDAANFGTLFLDEVGELPLDLQPKLLRLLEAREYQPLGSNVVRRAELRVVSATHRNLKNEVAAGRFRKDLYFRLAVAEVELPPLRARPDDIPLLAGRFARELSGVEVKLEPTTVAAFQCMQWPGNVRELRNAVERVLAFGTAEAPGQSVAEQPGFIEARDSALERFEKDYLQALLKQHDGQVTAAAKAARLARSHFYRLLERHGITGRRG
ncbi:MAG: sigma 54-dependent Fis family transcriptional regulator [Archangiaceae bacterium]|nr:sigma 54-dependent Fis family transcriptional regulator [Archangiaceae bacterium]